MAGLILLVIGLLGWLRLWRSVQDKPPEPPPDPMVTMTSRGGGQLRIMYSHDCRLFMVDPNSARWEAHPGTEFVLDDLRSWQINTERITLIEEGFAEPEPGE
jgi:hypothetical protein